MMKGSVWYVGAGPGDPELISVRGKRLLKEADLIIHDSGIAPELLAWSGPTTTLVNTHCTTIASPDQVREIAQQVIAASGKGQRVVRLKVGDPLFFSRALDEIRVVRDAQVSVQIVPGIASPLAATYAGVPLSNLEGSSCVVFTLASDLLGQPVAVEALANRARTADTICVMCLGSELARVAKTLMGFRQFAQYPCILVSCASTPEQRVLESSLADIKAEGAMKDYPEPCLLIAGEVTRWRQHISWFENRPLFGKRLLLCRPEHQAQDSARLMRERGARPLLLPLIEIAPPDDAAPLN